MRRVGPVSVVPPASVPELEAMLVRIVELARKPTAVARNERTLDAEIYLLRRGLVEPAGLFPIVEGEILARREYAPSDGTS